MQSTNRIDHSVSNTPAPNAILPTGQFAPITSRKISEKTCRLYDYSAGRHNTYGVCHYANVRNQQNQVIACHIRIVEPKGFRWVGESKDTMLFGQHTGKEGTLIITEGELDCMSVYECLSDSELRKTVVCSLNSGTGSVKKQIENNLRFILGFERVILFFDQDEAGAKELPKAAEIIGPKTRMVTGFPYKDASDAWVEGDSAAIKLAIAKAHPFRPDGVIRADSLTDKVLNPEVSKGYTFPWKGWNECTNGLRPGEVHLIAAGTGIGKSLFTRSIALHLCRDQNVKCAYIGLEESVETTYERMLSEAMAQPFYRWDAPTRREHERELRDAAKSFAHNLCLLDRFGMDDLRSFIATVKHYVLNEECKVVFLDHFSLLADGIDLRADQRRTIDKAIAELKTIAMDLGFCFVIVSHLSRDTGMGKAFEEGGEPSLSHLRGSASLGQIPSYIWMLQRNPMEESNNNETKCFLKKNRETGVVGMKSTIVFQPDIYRLTEVI